MGVNMELNSFKNYERGIHLYINIANLNYLVKKDETDNDMNHVFHLLNTFLVTIQRFICDEFGDEVFFEKLTGSRIHYILKGPSKIKGYAFIKICRFVILISKEILKIGKYNSFSSLPVQIGADIGDYVDFKFCDYSTKYEEYTSIGFPANYACKLQAIASPGEIVVSEKLCQFLKTLNYNGLTKVDFERSSSLKEKYNNVGDPYLLDFRDDMFSFFESQNAQFKMFKDRTISHYVDYARNVANNVNLSEMEHRNPRDISRFQDFTLSNNAFFDGTVVFADVRDFTKKFAPNGYNLANMSSITKIILSTMYNRCNCEKGIHVQFQGDREFVIFDEGLEDAAIIFALKLSDEITKIADGIHIGIGGNFGDLYAASIGINKEDLDIKKQPSILGKTIIEANKLEDQEAGCDEIVVSDTLYQKIKDANVKALFTKRKSYWVTSKKYSNFIELGRKIDEDNNYKKEVYNPWCI